MHLNRDLKLVLPARRSETGDTLLRAYHTPISYEAFEANYRIIAATKSALFSKGLVFAADTAPQIATLRLRDEARRDALEMGMLNDAGQPRDTSEALLAEIKRLTLVLVPTDAGWNHLPIDAAIRGKHLDAEEWREVESQIVFFTVAYAMAQRSARPAMATALAGVLRGETTSSNPTDYCDSLKTSTPVEISAKPAASSVPI
jgi:hypothetical protein